MKTLLITALTLLTAFSHALDLSAESAIIIEEKTGKVLWEKQADVRRYPASTTKIMTALLLLEHCLPSDMIIAPADIEKIKESSMHLKPFEQVSAKDMLYAMMLRSANDGCHAVATHISGSVPAFAKLMNERAKQIGCKNTTFNNPHGLNDDIHMTTARDLALIAREAMKYEPFRQVVKTQKYTINRSINFNDRLMVSRNKWLAKDGTADGIKTGYTRPAGLCYVGSATRDGYRVITVVLKSKNWQKDHQDMLHWAYKTHEKKAEIKKGDLIGNAQVVGGVAQTVPLSANADAFAVAKKAGQFERIVEVQPLTAPVKKGDTVGTLILRDSDGFEQRIPLVTQEDVDQAPFAAISKNLAGNSIGLALGSLLLVGAYLVKSRARRIIYGSST